MQLKILNLEELQNFQALYKGKGYKYSPELLAVNNIINLTKTKIFKRDFQAFTLSDPLALQLGLYVIMDRYQLLLGCLGTSLELLELALHLVDWSKVLYCTSVPTRYLETVRKVIREKNLEINFKIFTNLYYLSVNQALELEVDHPNGFELRPLTKDDAFLVDTEWAYREDGSLYFIQRQIQTNPSMGLYDVPTHKLIAWCIRTQDGYLAALKVREEYKRCGFGSLVVKALSQQIASLGEDVIAEVMEENIASNKTFQKLGFTVIDECHWLGIKPDSGHFTWPEGQ